MTPNEVVETLNDYFNQMIEIIFKYNGILDKIIGDELMVIYGVPKSNIQDSENAVLTAIEMQEKLIAFNQDRCINLKKPIKVGIGVNTGSVISGNIGSTDQMDFTVIGDSVNLASRLCSFAEAGQIIISDAVWNKIKHLQTFKSKKLSPIKVKGKAKVISIKEILYDDYKFDYQDAFDKVEAFLSKELPSHYTYHSIEHFRDVVKQVERIAKKEKVDKSGILDLKLAAWLHDVGYIWGPLDHEEKSVEYAKVILNEMKFPKSKISLITGMIMATKMPQSPKNHFEQIICDADLDYLGRNDFEEISSNLLKELEIEQKITNLNWLKIQEEFLKSHSYFTLTSQKSREKNKQKRLRKIEDILKTV